MFATCVKNSSNTANTTSNLSDGSMVVSPLHPNLAGLVLVDHTLSSHIKWHEKYTETNLFFNFCAKTGTMPRPMHCASGKSEFCAEKTQRLIIGHCVI